MDNTIRQVAHDKCTGCGACYNKCPKQAIRMLPDQEGFVFPQVINDKCVNCGLCVTSCPVIHPEYSNQKEPECYAVMASDEIRAKSSSGGIFSLLSEWVFEQKGVVCGAALEDDQYSVHHVIATSEDELAPLRGSKYVQSNTEDVYAQIKEFLRQERVVLFTGTPCQVAGLKSFLGKDYSTLYTVDLVCHGVPSPSLYKKFIQELERDYSSKAISVSFRDKSIVKWDVSTTIKFENGKIYQKKRNECPYLNSFLKLLTLRKCCGNCPFATLPRQGDMTIADLWDIHRYNPELDDRKGTSMALINNNKGQALIAVLKNKSVKCVQAPLEHAIKYNAQIKYSSVHHPRRNRFYNLLTEYNYDVSKAVDFGMNRRFDVGVVGWWYGDNYGSALTSFALNRVLKSMGKTVLMLEYPIVSGDVPAKKSNTATRRFANHFYEQSMLYPISEYHRFNYHCESFVVGSDQLWNWYSNKDVGSYHFFLDFVDNKHRKIAYSTSFGHEYVHYPEDMRLRVGYYLSRFDAISVREQNAVEVCRRDFNVDAVQTMDPVFLCDKGSYEEAIALSKLELKEPYVLAYILNPTEEKIEAVRLVAKKRNLKYHIILDGQADFAELKSQANDENVVEHVEIADWLKYFKNASYVVTDSFHGFCYSIVFQRNMSVFPNKLRGLDRFNSLAQMTGLTDRLVYSYNEFKDTQPWNTAINFETVVQRLQPEIDRSYAWLKTALERRKLPPSVKELQMWKTLEYDCLAHKLRMEGVVSHEDLVNTASPQNQTIDELKELVMKQQEELDKILWLPRKIKRIFRTCKKKLTFRK